MNTPSTISVQDFYDFGAKKLELELVSGEQGLNREIGETGLNRPSLALTGYLKHFASTRIQVFGAGEMGYLEDQSPDVQELILNTLSDYDIPCMVVSRGLTLWRQ